MAGGFTLGPIAARQIAETVRRVGCDVQSVDGRQSRRPIISGASFGVVDAIVTTQITACSTLTYGTGAADIYIDNESGVAIEDTAYPNAVTVYNWFKNSGTIPTTTHIKIHMRNGKWFLLSADC